MARRREQARRQRDQARREAGVRHTLALLRAAGKLEMIERDGATCLHIPPEHRATPATIGLYLLSCLPGQGSDHAAGGE